MWSIFAALILPAFFAGCDRGSSDRLQGYAEGEFVYVSSPLAGAIETLVVRRGDQVKVGEPLFTLERGAETALRDLSVQRLAEGRAKLADATKGMRPVEIDSMEAQLAQARAALVLSEKEFAREQSLFRSGAAAGSELDRARSAMEQDRQRVSQMDAELQAARLGSRGDLIAAAEANVRALQAALAKAEWDLSQKSQSAPQAALVFDTIYRAGEWVPVGRPVVSLLPPANIKVRAFVSEARIGAVHPGDVARVRVDGVAEPFGGKVSFISPQAEFTPPVIYSQESRGKLVFMIEITFDPAVAAKLHPGQPVDVDLAH